MTNLYINRYKDPNPVRQKELDRCYELNYNNKQIDKIYNVGDGERVTFRQIFDYINEVSGEDDLNIVANSDIYFKDLSAVKEHLKNEQVWALGRWEIYFNGAEVPFGRDDSQDCWMFKGKIRDVPDCNFPLGFPGSDNMIAERLDRGGYIVLNPSISIRTYHLHFCGIRNYSIKDIAPKPYLKITPHVLNEKKINRKIII